MWRLRPVQRWPDRLERWSNVAPLGRFLGLRVRTHSGGPSGTSRCVCFSERVKKCVEPHNEMIRRAVGRALRWQRTRGRETSGCCASSRRCASGWRRSACCHEVAPVRVAHRERKAVAEAATRQRISQCRRSGPGPIESRPPVGGRGKSVPCIEGWFGAVGRAAGRRARIGGEA